MYGYLSAYSVLTATVQHIQFSSIYTRIFTLFAFARMTRQHILHAPWASSRVFCIKVLSTVWHTVLALPSYYRTSLRGKAHDL